MKNEISARQALIVVLIILIAVLHSLTGNGQTIKQDSTGNYFTVQGARSSKSEGKATGKTLTLSDGQKLPVMESVNGKLYVVRVSKKTGKQYKQYLKIN